MANWLDLVSLAATIAFFGGIIYIVVLVVQGISSGVESAKEGLKTKGVHITDKGVAVKTNKRVERDEYLDATQRGLVNVVNASSFRKGGASPTPPSSAASGGLLSPEPASANSMSSTGSDKKKRGIFKRALSGSSSKSKDE